MNNGTSSERGMVLVVLAAAVSLVLVAAMASGLAGPAARAARDRASDRALAIAREALIAHAAGRPLDPVVGPGYLPCPDLDGDGWAEATCGSLNGATGQSQRLGRLPWKTLAIAEIHDGYGEALWYAVSSKHKGLLNCAASAGCIDMGPRAALGTISVRDASGALLHDGRIADPLRAGAGGVVAVVFAPGPAIERLESASGERRRLQVRGCRENCDPADFLDRAPGPAFADEDNADLVDRNDPAGRALNANGFIRGPVRLPGGALAVNDRLATLAYDDLMPRVMQRVAREIAHCLRVLDAPPPPAPACRIPDGSLTHCAIDQEASTNWWNAWRDHVFYSNVACDRCAAQVSGEARVSGEGFTVFVRLDTNPPQHGCPPP